MSHLRGGSSRREDLPFLNWRRYSRQSRTFSRLSSSCSSLYLLSGQQLSSSLVFLAVYRGSHRLLTRHLHRSSRYNLRFFFCYSAISRFRMNSSTLLTKLTLSGIGVEFVGWDVSVEMRRFCFCLRVISGPFLLSITGNSCSFITCPTISSILASKRERTLAARARGEWVWVAGWVWRRVVGRGRSSGLGLGLVRKWEMSCCWRQSWAMSLLRLREKGFVSVILVLLTNPNQMQSNAIVIVRLLIGG